MDDPQNNVVAPDAFGSTTAPPPDATPDAAGASAPPAASADDNMEGMFSAPDANATLAIHRGLARTAGGRFLGAGDGGNYLLDGLDEALASGGLRRGRTASFLTPTTERAKLALAPTYEGEIPRLWAIAGDGAQMWLDRLEGAPSDDDLAERVDRLRELEDGIVEDLAEDAAEVRELFDALDAPLGMDCPGDASPMSGDVEPSTMAAKKTGRRVKMADTVVDPVANTQMSDVPAPAPAGNVTRVVSPKGEQRQKNRIPPEIVDEAISWTGFTLAILERLKSTINAAHADLDRVFDFDAIARAYELIRESIPEALLSAYRSEQGRIDAQPVVALISSETSPMHRAQVHELLSNMTFQLGRQIERVPEGAGIDVNALREAADLLKRGANPVVNRQTMRAASSFRGSSNVDRATLDALSNHLDLISSMFAYLSDEERTRIAGELENLVSEIGDLAHEARTSFNREQGEVGTAVGSPTLPTIPSGEGHPGGATGYGLPRAASFRVVAADDDPDDERDPDERDERDEDEHPPERDEDGNVGDEIVGDPDLEPVPADDDREGMLLPPMEPTVPALEPGMPPLGGAPMIEVEVLSDEEPPSDDPLGDVLRTLPEATEAEDADVESRIADALEERRELERLIGDRAERVRDLAMQFREGGVRDPGDRLRHTWERP